MFVSKNKRKKLQKKIIFAMYCDDVSLEFPPMLNYKKRELHL